jgi:hypothetical protein
MNLFSRQIKVETSLAARIHSLEETITAFCRDSIRKMRPMKGARYAIKLRNLTTSTE